MAVHISVFQGSPPAPTIQVRPAGFLTVTTCLSLGLRSLNHPPPRDYDAFRNCRKSTGLSLFSQALPGCLFFHVQDAARGHFPWPPYVWWLRCTPRAWGAPGRERCRREETTSLHHWPYCWQRWHRLFKCRARCPRTWQRGLQTLCKQKMEFMYLCLAHEARSTSSKLPETWRHHTGELNCSSLIGMLCHMERGTGWPRAGRAGTALHHAMGPTFKLIDGLDTLCTGWEGGGRKAGH